MNDDDLTEAAERIRMLEIQVNRFAMAIERGETVIAGHRDGLKCIQDIAEEELTFVKVGTGAEVALRHIARRARETLAK